MKNIWPVTAITFREGIKNRVIFGIFIIALLLFAATAVITTLFMRDVVKVAVDMSLSTLTVAGLLTILFVGVNLYSKDLDKRTIYMVISRPVSRAEYIIGKFFGIFFLLLVVVIFLGLLSSVPVVLSKHFYFSQETRFSWQIFAVAAFYIFLKLAIISSVITFFASFTSNSFITLVLSLVVYVIGQSAEGVKALIASSAEVGEVNPILKTIVNITYYLFPNLPAFDLKTQAAHGIPVSSGYLLLVLFYAVFYMTIAVTASSLIFRRREFP